ASGAARPEPAADISARADMSSSWRQHRRGPPAFAPDLRKILPAALRRHASCVRVGVELKPIRRLLDLMARRRLRRIAARRIREMLAAPDSGRRLGYPAARRVETMESVLRVPDYVRAGLRRRRAHPDVATKRKPPLRRDANGTRHQVVHYLTASRRIA